MKVTLGLRDRSLPLLKALVPTGIDRCHRFTRPGTHTHVLVLTHMSSLTYMYAHPYT